MNPSITRIEDGNQTWTDCPYCGAVKAVAPSLVIPGVTICGVETVPGEESAPCMNCGAVVYF